MNTANHMDSIAPFHVMSLLGKAKVLEAQGRDIVHMEVGEPDFQTPLAVREAGAQALLQGDTFYTAATGLPELKQAIANFYARFYGVNPAPDNVVVTPGASGALQLVLSILVNPGDGVIITDPGYPCNRHFVELLHGRCVGLALNPDHGFRLTIDELNKTLIDEPKILIIASPSNPTGDVYTAQELQAIIRWCDDHGVIPIVDEIYQGLVYDSKPLSAWGMSKNVIIINSFSKYFNMTGWRLGWCVLSDELIAHADRLAQNLFLSAPTVAQRAALTAFTPQVQAIYQQQVAELEQRRNYLYDELTKLGFNFANLPGGAFYLFGKCDTFTDNSFAFCEQLLEQAGVAITPGIDFGSVYAKNYVRFAYTQPIERLKQGVERIKHFVNQ